MSNALGFNMHELNIRSRATLITDHAKDRFGLVVTSAVMFLGLIGFGSLLFAEAPGGLWAKLNERIAGASSWLMISALVLLVTGMFIFRKPGPRSRLFRLKHLSHHIPLWWAALSASMLSFALILSFPLVRKVLGIPEWLSFIPAPTYIWLYLLPGCAFLGHLSLWIFWETQARLHKAEKEEGPHITAVIERYRPNSATEVQIDHLNPETFLSKLGTDEPARSIQNDGLGTGVIARRIANRLKESVLPTHAVVGPLGSGKSTIGRFLREILQEEPGDPKVRVIQIELWPFLTPDAALAGILNRMFDEIEKDIGISHLRAIPRQYLDALESLPGFWQNLARWIRGAESDPMEILKQIDGLATMLKLRLVIWIDDLERFAGAGSNNDQTSTKGMERLSPIRALLHALGEQESITVVIATTSLEAGFDWEKIARYVHEIPRLDLSRTSKILKLFRERCLDRFMSPAEAKSLEKKQLESAWINPTPIEAQNEFKDWDLEGSYREHAEGIEKSGGFVTTPQAMALICQTPRALKQALRRAGDLWRDDSMRGEYQFDQMLALCLLREGCPRGFVILKDHWSRLQSGEKQRDNRILFARMDFDSMLKKEGASIDGDRLRTSDLRFDALLANLDSSSDIPALRFIAALWRSDLERPIQVAIQQIAEFLLARSEKVGPQGFRASAIRKYAYWNFFLEESQIVWNERDQVFMRKVIGATTEELADLLSIELTGKMLLEFQPALVFEMKGFLLTMVQRHPCEYWTFKEWNESYQWQEVIFELLRQIYTGESLPWNFRDEFEESIRIAMELNPNLVVQMERTFLNKITFQGWFDSENSYDKISSCIRGIFHNVYSAKVDNLIQKLEIPWALKQLCFGLDSQNNPKDPELRDISKWYTHFFGSILQKMTTCEEMRHKMVPQLAYVIVSNNTNIIRTDLAELLFKEIDLLFDLVLSEQESADFINPVMTTLFQYAKIKRRSQEL